MTASWTNSTDPSQMQRDDLRREVASIFALAILRLHAKGAMQFEDEPTAGTSLDLPPDTRVTGGVG